MGLRCGNCKLVTTSLPRVSVAGNLYQLYSFKSQKAGGNTGFLLLRFVHFLPIGRPRPNMGAPCL